MISIIIPLYNKQDCIKQTIDSCLNQDFESDYEIVVIDDGSTDNSLSIVEAINSDKIHLFRKQNGGPSSARNFGVAKSKGEWIVFLDADDRLCKNALSIFYNMTKRYSNILCFCANFFEQHNSRLKLYSYFYNNGIVKNPFKSWALCEFMPRTGAAMFHRTILQKYPYKEYLRRYEDAETLFDIMRNEVFACSKRPTMIYNTDTLSASVVRKDIKEDFLGHLSVKGKGFWERVILSSLYEQCKQGYPNDYSKLYNEKDFLNQRYYITKIVCRYVRKVRYVTTKILIWA